MKGEVEAGRVKGLRHLLSVALVHVDHLVRRGGQLPHCSSPAVEGYYTLLPVTTARHYYPSLLPVTTARHFCTSLLHATLSTTW